MIHTLRAESIKLRTVVVHWVLVLIAIGFPILVTTLVASLNDLTFDFDSTDISDLIGGLVVVSAMLLGSMAAISLTSEFSHNTIRPTYAATPNRMRVIASKLVVNTTAVLLVTAVTVAICWIVASLVLSGRGSPISLGDDGVLASLVGVCGLAVVVSWFAFGLGLVIRNSPATVTILLLWPLLIENLVALLFTLTGWDGAVKWLPYSAGITGSVTDNEPDTLGRPAGLIYFAAVTLAIVGLGVWLDRRRDA